MGVGASGLRLTSEGWGPDTKLALFCTNLVDINSKIMFGLKEENEMGGREGTSILASYICKEN